MRYLRRFRRPALVVCVLLAAALWLCGCLQTQEAIIGRYDADKDQFVFLNIYQRIAGEKPEDYDYLQVLWNNRDHLITPPMPNMLGKTSYLRLSPKTYYQINLGDKPGSLETLESPVPLDQVKVLPGKFFLRGEDALCYYDQIVVPGALADQVLKALSDKAAEAATAGVNEEIERRKNGGKPAAWEDVRKAIVTNVHEKPQAKPEGEDEHKTDMIRAMADESLQKLLAAARDHTAPFVREKSVFRVTVPLAEKDAGEFLATLKALREATEEEVKKPDHDKDTENQQLVLSAVEAGAVAGKGVALSVDAVTLFPRVQKAMDPVAELAAPGTPEDALRAHQAVEAIRGKNIPIDAKTTVQQIMADFQARKLEGIPPEKSVPPGEGLQP
jgi:hypothetical protein